MRPEESLGSADLLIMPEMAQRQARSINRLTLYELVSLFFKRVVNPECHLKPVGFSFLFFCRIYWPVVTSTLWLLIFFKVFGHTLF